MTKIYKNKIRPIAISIIKKEAVADIRRGGCGIVL